MDKNDLSNDKKHIDRLLSDIENKDVKIQQLNQKVEQLYRKLCEENLGRQILVREDPRINNRPLPNDSIMTYEYGARAYITSAYPGYVWRNGHWYSLDSKPKFVPDSESKLVYYTSTNINNSIEPSGKALLYEELPDHSIHLNDSFVPVFVNGIRYFMRFVKTSEGSITYIYVPQIQSTIMKACSKPTDFKGLVPEDGPIKYGI